MNIFWLLLGGSPFFGWWWVVDVLWLVVGGGIIQPNPFGTANIITDQTLVLPLLTQTVLNLQACYFTFKD